MYYHHLTITSFSEFYYFTDISSNKPNVPCRSQLYSRVYNCSKEKHWVICFKNLLFLCRTRVSHNWHQ